jgi:hypothetical protein
MAPLDFMWMAGRWLPSGYVTPGINDAMVDVFGQAITVGATVKLICKVIALNPSNTHFQDVTLKPIYPDSALVENECGVYPQNIPSKVTFAHPLQLVVGS